MLKDASDLLIYDKNKALEIEREVDAFLKKRSKSNRKLARDVAEWVDLAVSSSCRKNVTEEAERGGLSSVSIEDIEIDDDGSDGL